MMVGIFLGARLVYASFAETLGSTPLDEILVVCVGLLAPFGVRALAQTARGARFLIYFVAYAGVLLASSYLHPYSFERGANVFYVGLALDMKFFALFLGAYAFAVYRVRKDGGRQMIRLIMWALILTACVDSLQVIRDVTGGGTGFNGLPLDRRGPFYRPGGFLLHPVASAQLALFGFLASLTLLAKRATLIRAGVTTFLFLMLVAHVSVKEIIVGCLALMLFVLLFVRSDALTKSICVLLGLAAVGSVFASAAGDQITKRISYYTGEQGEDSARRVLYRAGVDIANDLVPLGAGSSTFGSQGSRTDGYSSLYFTYGVYGGWGMSKENDRYLLDTFWPKVLGETGYAGLLFFGLALSIVVGAAFRLMMATRVPEDAFLFVSLVGILIISVATAAMGEEFTGVLFYVLGAIALARASAIVPAVKRRRARARNPGRYRQRRRIQPGPTNANAGVAPS